MAPKADNSGSFCLQGICVHMILIVDPVANTQPPEKGFVNQTAHYLISCCRGASGKEFSYSLYYIVNTELQISIRSYLNASQRPRSY